MHTEPDTQIVGDNVRLAQALYGAYMLEQLRAFEVADRIAELFAQGMLPLDRPAAEAVRRYAAARERMSAQERAHVYAAMRSATAVAAAGGAGGLASNREFTSLWLRFVVAVSLYADRRGPAHLLTPASATNAGVRQAARALAANVSANAAALAPTAQRLADHAQAMLTLLGDRSLQAAFDARDMWWVIEQVSTAYLGGARSAVRYRTQAEAGRVVLDWLAANAAELSRPGAGASGDDAALVGAVERWLAVSRLGDVENTVAATPSGAAPSPRDRIHVPAIAKDLLAALELTAATDAERAARAGRMVMVFDGAPRTGMALAAYVLAQALSLDLLRVDLERVAGKYVGDTEKNLDAAFEQARGADVLLAFDETDALFGRRTEVKDSHDRYANVDLAALLQRIEAHSGPVVISTNLQQDLDATLARLVCRGRTQRVLRFPRPPAAGAKTQEGEAMDTAVAATSKTVATQPDPLGGYRLREPAPPAGRFDIGLALAGAVSAGAYTAGVIDFLTEALDAWESAKRTARAKFGTDKSKWDVPGHDVRIRVITGASAGAITGAIAGVAWRYSFTHKRYRADPGNNPLFKAWVQDVDITSLLGVADLRGDGGGDLVSLLDSSVLPRIAANAMSFKAQPVERPYLSHPIEPTQGEAPGNHAMRFVFTLGNLRGVPFFLAMPGSGKDEGHLMVNHSDRASFAVDYRAMPAVGARRADDKVLSFAQQPWTEFGTTAMASGAFPIGLSARLLRQDTVNFNYRAIVAPGPGVEPVVVPLLPTFPPGFPKVFAAAYVDGGTMNNEPFDQAHTELAGYCHRNPREPDQADRAVIMVDPFPDKRQMKWGSEPTRVPDILTAGLALLTAWKNQARFKPLDIALAADNATYSRYLVAPSRGEQGAGDNGDFHLACGGLGGFGGFMHQAFREHDYQLGRRNCQRFLKRHFGVAADRDKNVFNPLFAETGATTLAAFSYDDECADPATGGTRTLRHAPIIPLVGEVAREEPLPDWPGPVFSAESLRGPLKERLSAVVEVLIRRHLGANFITALAAKAGFWLLRNQLVDKAVAVLHAQLDVMGLARRD